jgi:3-oxocholest-4-en-26-oate---CoA ligase
VEFNVYDVVAEVAKAHPDREALVFGDRRLTAAAFMGRAHQFANVLLAAGLTVRAERDALHRHESGQPHVAVYLRNCAEYLEATIGSFAARSVPLNVNYRYVANEVGYLLNDGAADAVVFASEFAPVMAGALGGLTRRPVLLLQVDDGSDIALLDGAQWYEAVVAAASTDAPAVTRSPDDLYGIYTGGTTGRPKVVLWRQADAFCPLFGGRRPDGTEWTSIEEIVAAAAGGFRHMPVAPFMHAAGMWPAMRSFVAGNTLVVPPISVTFDAGAYLDLLAEERVEFTNIVGDAFVWPIVDELRIRPRAMPDLRRISTGGAGASPRARAALVGLLPHIDIYETVGASETGAQIAHRTTSSGPFISGAFSLLPRACVLSEDRTRLLEPVAPAVVHSVHRPNAAGDLDVRAGPLGEIGWIASRVRVPLGYLGDAVKTAATFPIINGDRYSVPGDRVWLRPDGLVDMLGRDSGMINTGGEKVFAEEVERALLTHPSVRDAVVCGRPNKRWGSEVVAIVSLNDEVTDSALRDVVRCLLAPYKVPRSIVRVPEVRRGPNAKIDLAWARQLAETSGSAEGE